MKTTMKSNKRLLMAVYNPIEYDGRVQNSLKALGKDFEVTLVCPSSSEKYEAVGFNLLQIDLSGFRRFNALKLFYFWLRFITRAILLRPCAVYGHDFFMSMPTYLAASFTGAKFIYDAHELIIPDKNLTHSKEQEQNNLLIDCHPDNRRDLKVSKDPSYCRDDKQGNYFVPSPKREKFFQLMERLTIKKADLVIAANEERAEMMKKYYCLATMPQVVRNIPQPLVHHVDDEKIFEEYPQFKESIKSKIMIVYQGDMDLQRGISYFISAMKHLDANYRLLMIGNGPDLDELKKITSKENVADKVIFFGKVPRTILYAILKICKIGIITYSNEILNHRYCAPNKIFEYAYMNIPVVSTCQPFIKKNSEKISLRRGGEL
jgi:glycosyltransferase involved in cell wall biosynthesis